jgi:hypothetical protein
VNKEVRPLPENFFEDWKKREDLAEKMWFSIVGMTMSLATVVRLFDVLKSLQGLIGSAILGIPNKYLM